MTTRPVLHAYGGIEHTQPGPFKECLLCQVERLQNALREIAAPSGPSVTGGITGQTKPAWELRRIAREALAGPDTLTAGEAASGAGSDELLGSGSGDSVDGAEVCSSAPAVNVGPDTPADTCECGHHAKHHYMESAAPSCHATVYTDAPLGGGSAYPCPCRSFVPADSREDKT